MSFNYGNGGYVGSSRSVRSAEAIESFEVPIAMITKDLVNEFIHSHGYSEEKLRVLKSVSVAKWKYAAKRVGSASWHHTGKFYNRTDHYYLGDIADYILENGADIITANYKEHIERERQAKAAEKADFRYGYIKVQVWGGTRKHPKVVDYDEQYGVVVGDWFYCLHGGKYKRNANKVVECKHFSDYNEFVKQYPSCKGRKREFNKLVNTITK